MHVPLIIDHTSRPDLLLHNSPTTVRFCQICGKFSHTTIDCFHHFDCSYQGRFSPQDLTAMVVETNATFDHQVWYMDKGANPILHQMQLISLISSPFVNQKL